ncbi:MAG: hypothetical protein ABL962_04935 [Fimbriimonadaceae bacterium]
MLGLLLLLATNDHAMSVNAPRMEFKITTSGRPSQNARVWTASAPNFTTTTQHMSASESGASIVDPDGGKGSGSASWSGVKTSFYEGETVTIQISCTNMMASFTALNCADGEASKRVGARHPWDPPRNTATLTFKFQPVEGRKSVGMNFMASPTATQRYNGANAQASWVFTPGTGEPPAQHSTLTAVDSQSVSASYLMRGSLVTEFPDISAFIKELPTPSGIAADGSSLLVLRAPVSKADSATFTVGGAGGALYPMIGETPVKSAGTTSLRVQTRESGGRHYALALYRPPSYFGRGNTSKPINFKVKFGGGAESTLAMKLVPPPIVLVHGTYDNPKFCYEEHADEDDTALNMAPQFRNLGYDVTCVDWEATNGNDNPSEFQDNRMTVWKNAGGIKEALEATRRKGIVVSQADVICHSQGGAITRTYARGYPFSISMPPTHPHYTDPNGCRSGDDLCWYHRADNYFLGDIHRLITISTTHRGSHVLNVFKWLATYPDKTVGDKLAKTLVDIFLVGIDKTVSGITTGGVKNQIPDSLELQLIGPTPVPSHAIACVATDEDMRNQRPDSIGEAIKGSELGMGNYWNKFYKVWLGTTDGARDFLFVELCRLAGENGMPNPDAELAKYRELASKVTIGEDAKNVRMDALIFQMRKIVFQGLENDCTVGIKSSFGGLEEPHRTRVPNTLHGWAPRYRAVQLRVLKLLAGDGSDFDNDGFPGYSGIKSKAATFATIIPPLDLGPPVTDNAISSNPKSKLPPKVGTGETSGSADFSPEKLAVAEAWKDSSAFGGTAKFEGGRLLLASPNQPEAEANTFLKSPLRGDFDVVIDYKLESWKAKGEGQVQFDVMLSPSPRTVGEDYILFGRRTTPEGDLVAVAPWKEIPGDEAKAATSGEGKLRVTRKGGKWVVSQWDGTEWKAVLSFESTDHPEVYLGFGLSTGGEAENAKVTVALSREG